MRTAVVALALSLIPSTFLAARGAERLALHVSPIVALAPATVIVQTQIEADADNRLLEVVVESHDYLRSSEISLDGDRAPRVNVVELRGIPPGLYEVRARLVGAGGFRASAIRTMRIVPGAGNRR